MFKVKKKGSLAFTRAARRAFTELKLCFVSAPILKMPNMQSKGAQIMSPAPVEIKGAPANWVNRLLDSSTVPRSRAGSRPGMFSARS